MNKYYKELDGLRFIAIAIVLIGHAGVAFPKSGTVGVEIFFVLSGFLITMILTSEYQRKSKINIKDFYIRRFLRLFPALIILIFLYCITEQLVNREIKLDVIVIVITYTANWARAIFDYDLGTMGHCWSLANEEQFYLIWPLIILFLEKNIKSHLNKFLILLFISLLCSHYRASLVGIYSLPRIYFSLDAHCDGLIMGSAMSYFSSYYTKHQKIFYKFESHYKKFIILISVIGLITLTHLISWINPSMSRIGFTIVIIISSLVISDLVIFKKSLLSTFLSFPLFVYLGKISYGLYLYHYPIFIYLESTIYKSDDNFLLQLPLKLLLTILLSVLSYHLIELKILKLKKHFIH